MPQNDGAMQNDATIPSLSPPPRPVSFGIRLRLMPFTIMIAFFLTVFGAGFWLISFLAQDKPGDSKIFINWTAGIFTALAVLMFIFAIRSWMRQVRLLRFGELAVAEILALHQKRSIYKRSRNWRFADWKDVSSKKREVAKAFKELRKRWETGGRDVRTRKPWDGVGSCLFRFQLPDDSIVVTSCHAVPFEQRLSQRNYDVNEIVVYDPADPEFAYFLSTFQPPLSVSGFGDWELASHCGKPSQLIFLIVMVCWVLIVVLFMML